MPIIRRAQKARKVKKAKRLTKKKQRSLVRSARRKALSAWSKKVRQEGCCMACGATNFLNAHHVLPKEFYRELMFETNNGVALCPKHHKFGKYSAHKNPIWFVKLLRSHCPAKYDWAIKHVGKGDRNEII
jgi:5-methylcytosine-specific restriction endonuclease McrA